MQSLITVSFSWTVRSQSWIVEVSYRDAVFMKLEMASALTAGRSGLDISFTLHLFKLQTSVEDRELTSKLDRK